MAGKPMGMSVGLRYPVAQKLARHHRRFRPLASGGGGSEVPRRSPNHAQECRQESSGLRPEVAQIALLQSTSLGDCFGELFEFGCGRRSGNRMPLNMRFCTMGCKPLMIMFFQKDESFPITMSWRGVAFGHRVLSARVQRVGRGIGGRQGSVPSRYRTASGCNRGRVAPRYVARRRAVGGAWS